MRFALLVLLVSVIAACASAPVEAQAPSSAAQAADVEAIRLMLDDLLEAAARADEKAYFANFTSDALIYGPDPAQRWDLESFRSFARKHYLQAGWKAQALRRDIALADDGRRAWFDEDLQTVNQGLMRGVGVVRKGDDDSWRIARYSFAMMVPEGRIGEVKALIARER